MSLTQDQVLAFAPDEASAKAGRGLATPLLWQNKGTDGRAAWAELKGSGANPYRTQVDLENIAFKCSCPSRKFPCKHGIGLLLLQTADPAAFTQMVAPAWVKEWIDKRDAKESKKEVPATQATAPDPEAQAKRAYARSVKVSGGIEELRLWMKDLLRHGLHTVPDKSYHFYWNIAQRMVDAQAPGLAGLLRNLGTINYFGEDWASDLLAQLSRIYLLSEAWLNLENFPPDMQQDVRSLIGFTQSQQELLATSGIQDNWLILGRQVEADDNLTTQRTWLYGMQSQRHALILNFAVRGQSLDTSLLPGTAVATELVFYPGTQPLRALMKEIKTEAIFDKPTMLENLEAVQNKFTDHLEVYPWLDAVPMLIANLTPMQMNNRWLLKDNQNRFALLAPEFDNIWTLMALSGGKPMDIFVIRKNNYLLPLGIWVNNKYKSLNSNTV